MPRRSPELARADLHARLQERRPEIEAAVITRVTAIAEGPEALDPAYAEGLRGAIAASVEHCLAAVELGEERTPPAPAALLAQARLAARSGVSLDTVLRRCVAGHALISDFLVEEAERDRLLDGAGLRRMLRAQASVADRVLAAVGEEHARELEGKLLSTADREAERVERLLAGELLDTSRLDYDFDGHHLGLIATGSGASDTIQALSAALERRLLLIARSDETVWAWVGGWRPFDLRQLQERISTLDLNVSLAVGEPAAGLGGWRLTHRQANAALPIALRSAQRAIRYSEVVLLASILRDDLLATSLRQFYLIPLECERDGGEVARKTLRAYFTAERNVSSAAAALGVNRHTVTSRLKTIEEKIGRPLNCCAAEFESALRLDELDSPSSDSRTQWHGIVTSPGSTKLVEAASN